MKKVQITVGAQRAFEWFAHLPDPPHAVWLEIKIHKGTGECVCSQCEDARRTLDQIVRASK